MELTIHKYIKDGLEYTVYLYQGLVCPNPTQTYLNTRSYQDLKDEYELLNCYKITQEDLDKYNYEK